MRLKDYGTLSAIFESHLSANPAIGNPATLYEPIRYINAPGGKRIRPVLLLMAYNLWFEDVSPALQAAMAVEYFHNFSLIHDDIMDEAQMRRGRESVHTRFGKNAGILSGDAMLIKSFDYLIDIGEKYRLGSSLSGVLAKTALEICEGQQMDMDFETHDDVTESEYLEMIRKKTASLIGSCLRLGALLTNASADTCGKLYSFGENIGMAFQIRDDILDSYGDSNATGKQHGSDILRGKKNFLYVRTINSLGQSEKKEFISAYQIASTESEINTIVHAYDDLQLKDYAQQKQNEFFMQAVQCLDGLPSLDTTMLRNFALELMSRDH